MSKTEVKALNSALTAIPLITSVIEDVLPPFTAKAIPMMDATAASEPAKEKAGSRNNEARPVLNASKAPNPAPAETPSRPGSANGLRNTPCITAPEIANPPPAKTPQITRGSLIEVTARYTAGFTESRGASPQKASSERTTSLMAIDVLPTYIETTAVTSRAITPVTVTAAADSGALFFAEFFIKALPVI